MRSPEIFTRVFVKFLKGWNASMGLNLEISITLMVGFGADNCKQVKTRLMKPVTSIFIRMNQVATLFKEVN